MTADELTFVQDELPGFEQATIALRPEDDGELCATLVRRKPQDTSSESPRPAVLYLHGFADYYFQTHLAEAVEESGHDFYALDLRRYGRSLRPGNRANQARDIEDYFEELDAAFAYLLERHGRVSGWINHSTGALVAVHYLERGTHREHIRCAVLNSPFFRFHLRPHERGLSLLAGAAGRFLPRIVLPQRLSATYGRSIHESGRGIWGYNLEHKPLRGFPLYAGWFAMIRKAQRHVRKGMQLQQPILVLHSSSSHHARSEEPDDRDLNADIVVDVNDIRSISPRLGPRVRLQEIHQGKHDLFLSEPGARAAALSATLAFLSEYGADP